jgi:hypothetical protein
MSYTFDYIVGALECRICGKLSPLDISTDIQTKIALRPMMGTYGIGDFLEIEAKNIEGSGYLAIIKPASEVVFSFVETWECPHCDACPNWVIISVDNGTIQSMQSTSLEDVASGGVNYITEDCKYSGWVVRNGELLKER